MLDEKSKELINKYLFEGAKIWMYIRSSQIPLGSIYVMFQAVEIVENRLPGPLKRRSDATKKERQKANSFPGKKESGDADSSNKRSPENKTIPSPLPLSKIFAESRHLVLLGEPGSGKSTSLQFISLCFANAGWGNKWFAINEPLVPLLLVLKDYAEIISTKGLGLEKALAIAINQFLDLPEDQAKLLVTNIREDNRLLILLDGLDEVPENMRPSVAAEIGRYAGLEKGKMSRIVLTSRQAGYQSGYISHDKDLRTFKLKPFLHPEDAAPYLQHWLAVQPNWDKRRAAGESAKLLAEIIRRPALRRFVDNPLLLRLAVQTFALHGDLANNRGKMYEEYVSQTVWMSINIEPSLSTGARRNIALDEMEKLAWQLQSEGRIEDPPSLELLIEKLRLVELDGSKFKFSHKTFQEYFVARRLAKAWVEESTRSHVWAVIQPRLHNPDWHEPLLLFVGMLDKDLAADLIAKVLNNHSPWERELFRDLFLAAELLGERSDIDAKFKPTRVVISQLKKLMLKFSYPSYRFDDVRQKASKSLAVVGEPVIPALIPLLKKYFISKSLDISNKYYSSDQPEPKEGYIRLLKRISENISRPLIRFKDEIREYENDVKRAYSRVLINIGKSVIPALQEPMNSSRPFVRRNAIFIAVEIYKKYGNEFVSDFMELINDQDQFVRKYAIDALVSLKEKQVIPLLEQFILKDGMNSIWQLEEFGSSIIPVLERIFEHKKEWANEIARSLYQIDDPAIIPLILKMYLNEYWYYREEHRKVLRGFGSKATPYLLHALREIPHEDGFKRSVIISELSDVGDPRLVSFLSRQLRNEKDIRTRKNFLDALGSIGTENVYPILLKELLTTQLNGSIYESIGRLRPSARALAKLGPIIIPKLASELEYLTEKITLIFDRWEKWPDQNRMFDVVKRCISLRFSFVEILSELRTQSTTPILLEMLGHVAWEIESLEFCSKEYRFLMDSLRQKAKKLNLVISEALGRKLSSKYDDISYHIDDHIALKILYECEYSDLYNEIIRALGGNLDNRCVPALCFEISDDYNYFAVDALAKIGSSSAAPQLTNLLNKAGNISERHQISVALFKCGDPGGIPVLCNCLPLYDNYHSDSQLEAVNIIGKFGSSNTELILREFFHSSAPNNERSRITAAAYLAKMGDQEALDILVNEFEENSYMIADVLKDIGAVKPLLQCTSRIQGHEALSALEEMNISALSDLVCALQNPEPRLRLTVVGLLEKLGLPALDGLILALSDSEVSVRKKAASALNKLNDQRAVPALVSGLSDPESDVRWVCAVALGKLGDQRALPIFLNGWPYSIFTESEERDIIIKILGDFGDEKCIPFLMKLGGGSSCYAVLEKIVGRVDSKTVDSLQYPIRLARIYKEREMLEILITRQEILKAPKLTNPLEPLQLSTRQQLFRTIPLFVGALFLAAVGAVLASDIFQGTLTKMLPVSLQTLALAHPTQTTIIRIGIFGAFGMLIKLSLDVVVARLKKNHVFDNGQ